MHGEKFRMVWLIPVYMDEHVDEDSDQILDH